MGTPFPVVDCFNTYVGFQRLQELVEVALLQTKELVKDYNNALSIDILKHVDELLVILPERAVDIGPLVRWFQTERLRLKPMKFQQVCQETIALFEKLNLILSLYVPSKDQGDVNAATALE